MTYIHEEKITEIFEFIRFIGTTVGFRRMQRQQCPVTPRPDVEEVPSIGSYSFRGEMNKIVSGVASGGWGLFDLLSFSGKDG